MFTKAVNDAQEIVVGEGACEDSSVRQGKRSTWKDRLIVDHEIPVHKVAVERLIGRCSRRLHRRVDDVDELRFVLTSRVAEVLE